MPALSSPLPMTIRPATPKDCELLIQLIRELADYERLADEVTATGQILQQSLFGSNPAATAVIAEVDAEVVGYALFYPTFSTFTGQAGLYLEDIYVRARWRTLGLGKQLFQHVARIAVDQGCPRLEWSVLDWNQPAIDFYQRLEAEPLSDWLGRRLTGTALKSAAGLAEDC